MNFALCRERLTESGMCLGLKQQSQHSHPRPPQPLRSHRGRHGKPGPGKSRERERSHSPPRAARHHSLRLGLEPHRRNDPTCGDHRRTAEVHTLLHAGLVTTDVRELGGLVKLNRPPPLQLSALRTFGQGGSTFEPLCAREGRRGHSRLTLAPRALSGDMAARKSGAAGGLFM